MKEFPCLIDDDEFAALKKFFEKNNPFLYDDNVSIRKKTTELQNFMQELIEQPEIKPEEIRDSVIILSQGINFLLRYLAEKQIDYLEIFEDIIKVEKIKILPEPILSKHVAVYVSEIVLANCLKQSLNLNSELRYQVYLSIDEILANIINGQIIGVIGIHLSKEGKIENTLRHDLKNMEEHNYESAQEYVFPPCTDIFSPHNLLEIMQIISLMQQAKYQTQSNPVLPLNELLPTLKAIMFVPKNTIRIVIVDDIEKEMAGMFKILSHWPNVKVDKIIPDSEEFFTRPYGIYLLDEEMGRISGTKVQANTKADNPHAFYVSTSGGLKPNWAKYHFDEKAFIAKHPKAAYRFVRFINKFLQKFD